MLDEKQKNLNKTLNGCPEDKNGSNAVVQEMWVGQISDDSD